MKKSFIQPLIFLFLTMIITGCYSKQQCAAYSSIEENIEDVVYLE